GPARSRRGGQGGEQCAAGSHRGRLAGRAESPRDGPDVKAYIWNAPGTETPVAVRVTCQCGTSYELKDEFAGRLVKCPQCGRDNRVPGVVPAEAVKPQADPVFDRDVFLLRLQLLRVSEKYDVADGEGKEIVLVWRAAQL